MKLKEIVVNDKITTNKWIFAVSDSLSIQFSTIDLAP